jgi:hypothetical protein
VDLAVHDPRDAVLVATEIESLIRRVEQLLRWHEAKAAALPSSRIWPFVAADGAPTISRLLIIRSTRATRELARDHARLLATAYPAPAAEAHAALTGTGVWPGSSILWADIRTGGVRIMEGPPRGVTLGR